MGAAIGMRDDLDAAGLRRLARATRSANQGRRLLALAEIYDGGSRSDAVRIGGVTLQIVGVIACWAELISSADARSASDRA